TRSTRDWSPTVSTSDLQLPLGRDPHQFAGDLADALLDPRLARLPADPAEPVELCPGLFRAVARQHLDVLDRHEQPVVAGIEHLRSEERRVGRGCRWWGW